MGAPLRREEGGIAEAGSSTPDRTAGRSEGARARRVLLFCWLGVFAAIAFAAVFRLRLIELPLERDEGDYAYMAQLLLDGVPPYTEAYDMRTPGTFLVYAGMIGLLGEGARGIHAGLLLVNAVTIALLFLLGRRLFGPVAGCAAAVSYAALSLNRTVGGMTANSEPLLLLPAVAGVLALVRGTDRGEKASYLLSGLLLGIALTIKQHAIFFVAFGALAVVWVELRRERRSWRSALVRIALYSLGTAAPIGLVGAWLSWTGAFDDFWFWTVVYPREYVAQLPLDVAVRNLRRAIPDALGRTRYFWLLASIGLTAPIWNRELRARAVFAIGFLAFSLLAIAPGFYFRWHYFLLLMPALALSCGMAVESLDFLLRGRLRTALVRTSQCLLVLAPFSAFLVSDRTFLFESTPVEAARIVYGPNPFPETLEIAKYIEERSGPEDAIAVFGSEPQIFFYSGRRSASPYILMYELIREHPYSETMQRELIQQVSGVQPPYIVLVHVWYSWLAHPARVGALLQQIEPLLASRYHRVGLVEILSPRHTRYLWEEEARFARATARYWLEVYERSDFEPRISE